MLFPNRERYERGETLATVAWFLLDASWLFDWRWLAALCGAAALAASAWSARHAERDVGSVAVALGVLAWVLMSGAWVLGDLGKLPWALTLAKVCAGLVAACLVVALGSTRGTRAALEELLRHLRRMRM